MLDASKHQLEMASEMDGGLLFDEKVSEIVRNYPCLYDKRRKDYKDKNVVANAWASVEVFFFTSERFLLFRKM